MNRKTISAVNNDSAVIRAVVKAAGSEQGFTARTEKDVAVRSGKEESLASAINAAAAIVSTMMGECDFVQPVLKAIDGEEFLRRNPGFIC